MCAISGLTVVNGSRCKLHLGMFYKLKAHICLGEVGGQTGGVVMAEHRSQIQGNIALHTLLELVAVAMAKHGVTKPPAVLVAGHATHCDVGCRSPARHQMLGALLEDNCRNP